MSIVESLGKPQSDEQEPRAPARTEHKLRAGNIVGLDIISSQGDGGSTSTNAAIVAYGNGSVDCISGDLSRARWQHDNNDDAEVEYATVLDLDGARRGLLKGREDVLALLEQSSEASDPTPPLLFQVLRRRQQRSVRLSSMQNTYGDQVRTRGPFLTEILSYDLPSQKKIEHVLLKYELHAASGVLYQQVDQQLFLFDLSGTLPRLAFRLGRGGTTRVDSFTRLSNASVAVVSKNTITVYDTKYGSVLSTLAYTEKQLDGATETPLQIVSQFADISAVVALSGTELLAFQVGDILDDGRRAKAKCPQLVDVIGKAKFSDQAVTMHHVESSERRRKKWAAWTSQVDQFIAGQDVKGLEDLLAVDLGLHKRKDEPVPVDHTQQKPGLSQHTDAGQDVVWQLPPHSYDPEHVNPRKAIYLLGKIFAWRASKLGSPQDSTELRIALCSRNILRWLALAGYLTASHIQHALFATNGLQKPRLLTAGDLMRSIRSADPSFQLMCDLLSLPIHWNLAEVVQGLQTLVASLEDRVPAGQIEDTRASAPAGGPTTNGAEDEYLDSEVDALDRQLIEAQTILESGLAIRSQTCRIILARLQTFAQKDLVKSMHAIMSYDDLVFFICILRVELNDGGWMYDYLESGKDEPASVDLRHAHELAPSNQAIRSIANMFSCAVDAIGLSGWLVGQSADVLGTLNLVHDMRNEISATLEGLYEAEHLGSMLKDISKAAVTTKRPNHLKRKWREDEQYELGELLMPVGGRPEPPQVKTLSVKDSQNPLLAAAQQKSRNVGKYSFERIRI